MADPLPPPLKTQTRILVAAILLSGEAQSTANYNSFFSKLGTRTITGALRAASQILEEDEKGEEG